MDKQFFLLWTISAKDIGLTIKEFLKEREISKAALTDIKFGGGGIFVNGKEVNVRYVLGEDDTLKVVFPLEIPSEGMRKENIPLNIVFEDEYLLVVNKPPFMNTIPSREHPTGSLANAILGYYERIGLIAAPHIVTRLDRNTSGLVLIAKHRHVHHLLSKQQKNGLVDRMYVALVHGQLGEDSGTVKEPIGRKLDSIIEREVTVNGQYACTHYQILQRYNEICYIQLKLETGRTHQIRVHMSYLGHPIVGDDLYGGEIELINRQALHCRKLSFFHPFNKKILSFEVPVASDMENIMK
ncbi:RluA family pseudouridine synthase [Bacillus sp. CGMCC 1.16607]|uniref:RluA family pseudouridine synthase n=1 Tax=Bacillus sp. CGMCC 1.16607 TaxID=3351842 RepID=UPI0036298D4D